MASTSRSGFDVSRLKLKRLDPKDVDVLTTLGPEYFTDDFDPIPAAIESIDTLIFDFTLTEDQRLQYQVQGLDHIKMNQLQLPPPPSALEDMEYSDHIEPTKGTLKEDDQIEKQLAELSLKIRSISSILQSEINVHKHHFMDGLVNASQVHSRISSALTQGTRLQTSIESVIDDGIVPSLSIVAHARAKQRLIEVHTTMQALQHQMQFRARIQDILKQHDLSSYCWTIYQDCQQESNATHGLLCLPPWSADTVNASISDLTQGFFQAHLRQMIASLMSPTVVSPPIPTLVSILSSPFLVAIQHKLFASILSADDIFSALTKQLFEIPTLFVDMLTSYTQSMTPFQRVKSMATSYQHLVWFLYVISLTIDCIQTSYSGFIATSGQSTPVSSSPQGDVTTTELQQVINNAIRDHYISFNDMIYSQSTMVETKEQPKVGPTPKSTRQKKGKQQKSQQQPSADDEKKDTVEQTNERFAPFYKEFSTSKLHQGLLSGFSDLKVVCHNIARSVIQQANERLETYFASDDVALFDVTPMYAQLLFVYAASTSPLLGFLEHFMTASETKESSQPSSTSTAAPATKQRPAAIEDPLAPRSRHDQKSTGQSSPLVHFHNSPTIHHLHFPLIAKFFIALFSRLKKHQSRTYATIRESIQGDTFIELELHDPVERFQDLKQLIQIFAKKDSFSRQQHLKSLLEKPAMSLDDFQFISLDCDTVLVFLFAHVLDVTNTHFNTASAKASDELYKTIRALLPEQFPKLSRPSTKVIIHDASQKVTHVSPQQQQQQQQYQAIVNTLGVTLHPYHIAQLQHFTAYLSHGFATPQPDVLLFNHPNAVASRHRAMEELLAEDEFYTTTVQSFKSLPDAHAVFHFLFHTKTCTTATNVVSSSPSSGQLANNVTSKAIITPPGGLPHPQGLIPQCQHIPSLTTSSIALFRIICSLVLHSTHFPPCGGFFSQMLKDCVHLYSYCITSSMLTATVIELPSSYTHHYFLTNHGDDAASSTPPAITSKQRIEQVSALALLYENNYDCDGYDEWDSDDDEYPTINTCHVVEHHLLTKSDPTSCTNKPEATAKNGQEKKTSSAPLSASHITIDTSSPPSTPIAASSSVTVTNDHDDDKKTEDITPPASTKTSGSTTTFKLPQMFSKNQSAAIPTPKLQQKTSTSSNPPTVTAPHNTPKSTSHTDQQKDTQQQYSPRPSVLPAHLDVSPSFSLQLLQQYNYIGPYSSEIYPHHSLSIAIPPVLAPQSTQHSSDFPAWLQYPHLHRIIRTFIRAVDSNGFAGALSQFTTEYRQASSALMASGSMVNLSELTNTQSFSMASPQSTSYMASPPQGQHPHSIAQGSMSEDITAASSPQSIATAPIISTSENNTSKPSSSATSQSAQNTPVKSTKSSFFSGFRNKVQSKFGNANESGSTQPNAANPPSTSNPRDSLTTTLSPASSMVSTPMRAPSTHSGHIASGSGAVALSPLQLFFDPPEVASLSPLLHFDGRDDLFGLPVKLSSSTVLMQLALLIDTICHIGYATINSATTMESTTVDPETNPKAKTTQLETLYQSKQLLKKVSTELVIFHIAHTTDHAVKSLSLPAHFSNTNWAMNKMATTPSPFVDKAKTAFIQWTQTIQTQLPCACFMLPIYTGLSLALSKELVLGITRVKKIVDEGKAQLALDISVINDHVSKLINIRPIPFSIMPVECSTSFYYEEKAFTDWVAQQSLSLRLSRDTIMSMMNANRYSNASSVAHRVDAICTDNETKLNSSKLTLAIMRKETMKSISAQNERSSTRLGLAVYSQRIEDFYSKLYGYVPSAFPVSPQPSSKRTTSTPKQDRPTSSSNTLTVPNGGNSTTTTTPHAQRKSSSTSISPPQLCDELSTMDSFDDLDGGLFRSPTTFMSHHHAGGESSDTEDAHRRTGSKTHSDHDDDKDYENISVEDVSDDALP